MLLSDTPTPGAKILNVIPQEDTEVLAHTEVLREGEYDNNLYPERVVRMRLG